MPSSQHHPTHASAPTAVTTVLNKVSDVSESVVLPVSHFFYLVFVTETIFSLHLKMLKHFCEENANLIQGVYISFSFHHHVAIKRNVRNEECHGEGSFLCIGN